MKQNPFNRRTSSIGQPQHLEGIRTPHEAVPSVHSACYEEATSRQDRINRWTDRATIPIVAGLLAITAWAGYSYPMDAENCSIHFQKEQDTFAMDISFPDEC